ncbi:MAG: hypothetical protein DRQ14_06650, partial [Candidatus Latescibacterota bacterium]
MLNGLSLFLALLALPASEERLVSHSGGDIRYGGGRVWLGTSEGLALWKGPEFEPKGFTSFTQEDGIGRGAVSALAVHGDTVWVATVYDTTLGGRSYQVGDGLSVSLDGGRSWRHITNEDIFSPLGGPGTPVQNPAFGLAISDGTVWAAFWAGSLVRSDDGGSTWLRVLPDTSYEKINYTSLRHRTFDVLAYGDTVWVGTAAGISRSDDGGRSWRYYTVKEGLAGNWVVTLARQFVGGKWIIWAGVKSTGEGERDGLCRTSDDGTTWEVVWDRAPWNLAFVDSVVWAATDEGLYRSSDLGRRWEEVVVEDLVARERLEKFIGVCVVGDSVWASSDEGIALSVDGGESWRVLKVPVWTASLDEGEVLGEGPSEPIKTYAYRNPFSISRHGRTRIQYSLSRDARVSIYIYDLGGRLVRRLLQDEP